MVRNVVTPAMNSVRTSVPCCASPKWRSSDALNCEPNPSPRLVFLTMRPSPAFATPSLARLSPHVRRFAAGLWIPRTEPLHGAASWGRFDLSRPGNTIGLPRFIARVYTSHYVIGRERAMDFDPVLLARLQFAFTII